MAEKKIFNGYNREAARKQLGKDISILFSHCTVGGADMSHEAGLSSNTIKDIRDGKTSVKLDSCFSLLEYLARKQQCSKEEVWTIIERYLKALFL